MEEARAEEDAVARIEPDPPTSYLFRRDVVQLDPRAVVDSAIVDADVVVTFERPSFRVGVEHEGRTREHGSQEQVIWAPDRWMRGRLVDEEFHLGLSADEREQGSRGPDLRDRRSWATCVVERWLEMDDNPVPVGPSEPCFSELESVLERNPDIAVAIWWRDHQDIIAVGSEPLRLCAGVRGDAAVSGWVRGDDQHAHR
jgi:hypothetical protein